MPDQTPKVHEAQHTKPRTYQGVHVWLVDGQEVTGVWTGNIWWGRGGEIHPVRWREFDDWSRNADS